MKIISSTGIDIKNLDINPLHDNAAHQVSKTSSHQIFYSLTQNDVHMSSQKNSSSKKKPDYYQIVTDRILTLLDEGTPPWRKTWGSYGLAKNYDTGHVYKGINMVMLNMAAPYDVPYYLTWKQVQKLGGTVTKGSKAEYVHFYKEYEKKSKDPKADPEFVRFLKRYAVFNISCIEGIDFEIPEMPIYDNKVIEQCEAFIKSISPTPDFKAVDGARAYYNFEDDHIRVPHLRFFEASEEYYTTVFHELTHWTSHESRLNREGARTGDMNSLPYAEEELIAEFGASFLCSLTGIDREKVTENSAAYIQSWKDRLRADKKLLFRAASQAQKAVDYLQGSR